MFQKYLKQKNKIADSGFSGKVSLLLLSTWILTYMWPVAAQLLCSTLTTKRTKKALVSKNVAICLQVVHVHMQNLCM